MLLQLFLFFSPLYSPLFCTTPPTAFPHLSSCPWVIHISSLASPLPILFLPSPDADSGPQDPCVVYVMNKLTQTAEVLWRKRDSMAIL